MSERKRLAVLRQVLGVLKGWTDPHGGQPYATSESLQGVEASATGVVTIQIKPARPHCPCCLLDLSDLRTTLLERKGVHDVALEVVGVPGADRWTRALAHG